MELPDFATELNGWGAGDCPRTDAGRAEKRKRELGLYKKERKSLCKVYRQERVKRFMLLP